MLHFNDGLERMEAAARHFTKYTIKCTFNDDLKLRMQNDSLLKTLNTVVCLPRSMDECEALCTRLVIMVNGRFKCVGSLQHLKNKFGKDYLLTMQVSRLASGALLNEAPLKGFLRDRFPRCVEISSYQGQLKYTIPEGSVTWAVLFSALEEAKSACVYNLEDYSFCQTTLEQIFINFAVDSNTQE